MKSSPVKFKIPRYPVFLDKIETVTRYVDNTDLSAGRKKVEVAHRYRFVISYVEYLKDENGKYLKRPDGLRKGIARMAKGRMTWTKDNKVTPKEFIRVNVTFGAFDLFEKFEVI